MSNDPRPTKYQVQIYVTGQPGFMPQSWNCRRDGRPNTANIRRFVKSFEASTDKGGCNAHLGKTTIARAEIRLNDGSGKVVTTYEAPGQHKAPGGGVYMFEVVSEFHL